MKHSFIALALGTFGLGISEFVMMGILPYMASDFHVGIAEAGHLISAYALGVCVGAPAVALFARKWRLRNILYLLMGIYSAAAAMMAICPAAEDGSRWQFVMAMIIRFLQGTPHGAYFGVSSIVADRIAEKGKAAFAIAIICSGMAIANLIGNPLCTFVTSVMSWRYVFCFTSIWGLLTLFCIARHVPNLDALPDHGVKGEFRFMKHLAPWLLFGCTMFGNSGVFCWYSYISPTMTELARVPEKMMTFIMVTAGAGMVLGNMLGGKLSDKFGPGRTGRGIVVVLFLSLTATYFAAHIAWCAIPLMVINVACLFAVSSPQQILFVRHSKGGELMGGAMVQIAFNFGNAVGAWAGGLPITEAEPTSYHFPALIGAGIVLMAVICYTIFCNKYERQ